MNRVRQWWHRACQRREAAWAQEYDRLETSLLRVQKQYDDLFAAYSSLVETSVSRLQPFPNMEHLFTEDESVARQEFLTPTLEDREGTVAEGV